MLKQSTGRGVRTVRQCKMRRSMKLKRLGESIEIDFVHHYCVLTLSVLSDVYIHLCTIRADVHICPGTAGSSEIIIQGQIVSAAENNKNG